MSLLEICKSVTILDWVGKSDIDISGLNFDSRKIIPGELYIAQRGYNSDGHEYVDQAISNGAVAVLCEELPKEPTKDIIYIKVKSTREILGLIAAEFYGNPSSRLKLIGVTGTNGKTTIATVLYQLLMKMGYKTGLISTVTNFIADQRSPSTHTTPDPVSINNLLSKMVEEGCEYCLLEVSSHAIVQNRITGLNFAGGIFTNITQDHLDYHKTFPEYLKAKKTFFDKLSPNAFALTNLDDKNGNVVLQNTAALKKTYSLNNYSDFMCKIIESHFDSMNLEIDGVEIWTPFIGDFNASNLLAVYGCAILLKQQKNEILKHLSKIYPVRGRCEYLKLKKGTTAIIDYAHTPDALMNVLETINKIKSGNEKIITVVGAGGDRDKGKRPIMGKIAANLSDRLILTSDNPRSENPEIIISEMESGITGSNKNKVIKITDRKEAIKTAVIFAEKEDIILVAGKGHEEYQEINGVKNHFNDREILEEITEMNYLDNN
ncbi:UDP-N-acetylmuramoyl-L-alanyl-D-glutamate--2,6-diaminopimelate ligase [Bacteroidota bacterium]